MTKFLSYYFNNTCIIHVNIQTNLHIYMFKQTAGCREEVLFIGWDKFWNTPYQYQSCLMMFWPGILLAMKHGWNMIWYLSQSNMFDHGLPMFHLVMEHQTWSSHGHGYHCKMMLANLTKTWSNMSDYDFIVILSPGRVTKYASWDTLGWY